MNDRAKTSICVLFLSALVVLLFADILFQGKGLFLLDLSRYHYPMKRIVRDTILSGEFPWWNRFYSGGQPMAANPAYEVFYPGQWPILIGSYRFGYNLHIILHLWVALLGMFLFLREDGACFLAAVIGALSFATGGYFFGAMTILPTCFVWAWTPLAAMFLWRWRRRRDIRWLAMAALPLGMQVLVGEPVSLIQNWILIGLCAIADAWTDRESRRKRLIGNAVALTIVAALAISLGAAQLLPGADHLRDTSRSEGLSYRIVVGFSSAAERPLELLYPHYFGSHRDAGPNYWGVSKFHGAPYLLSIYLGLLIAVGVLASTVTRPGEALPVLLFCGVVYLAALGEHTPFFDALYDLGIATRFRYPEKFLSLIVVPLIWLGVRTIHRFLQGDRSARLAVAGSASLAAFVTTALMCWSRTNTYHRWFVDHWSLRDVPETEPLIALSRTYWLSATALTVALAILLWSRRFWNPRVWAAAIVAFVLVDLSQMHAELAPRMPPSFFRPPGIVRALGQLDAFSTFHIGDWLLDYFHPGYDQAGYGRYWLERNVLRPPTQASWGIRSAMDRDYDETYLRGNRDVVSAMLSLNLKGVSGWWQPFAAFSNVGYVVDYRDFDQVVKECAGHFEVARSASLRRFAAAAPRYYFATTMIEAPTWQRVAAIVRERGVVPAVAFVQSSPFLPAAGRVLGVQEGPSDARIEVESSGTSFLVMTVTRHRYWQLRLDGHPVPSTATNIAYQGLAIPPGRHVVTMRYRNSLVIAGVAISVAAFSAIIAGIILGRWKID